MSYNTIVHLVSRHAHTLNNSAGGNPSTAARSRTPQLPNLADVSNAVVFLMGVVGERIVAAFIASASSSPSVLRVPHGGLVNAWN